MLLIIEPERISTSNKMSIVELSIPNSESLQSEAIDVDTVVKDNINDTEVLANASEIVNIVKETIVKVSSEIKNDDIVSDNFRLDKPDGVSIKSQTDTTHDMNKDEGERNKLKVETEFEHQTLKNGDTDSITMGENNGSVCNKERESAVSDPSITTSACAEDTMESCNKIELLNGPEEAIVEMNTICASDVNADTTNMTKHNKNTDKVVCNGSVSFPDDGVMDNNSFNDTPIVNNDKESENRVSEEINNEMREKPLEEDKNDKEENSAALVEMSADNEINIEAEKDYNREENNKNFVAMSTNKSRNEEAEKKCSNEVNSEDLVSMQTDEAQDVEAEETVNKEEKRKAFDGTETDEGRNEAAEKKYSKEVNSEDLVLMQVDEVQDTEAEETVDKEEKRKYGTEIDEGRNEAAVPTDKSRIEEADKNDNTEESSENFIAMPLNNSRNDEAEKSNNKEENSEDLVSMQIDEPNNVEKEKNTDTEENKMAFDGMQIDERVNEAVEKSNSIEQKSNEFVAMDVDDAEAETIANNSNIKTVENDVQKMLTENSQTAESVCKTVDSSDSKDVDADKIKNQSEKNENLADHYKAPTDENISTPAHDNIISTEVNVNLVSDKDSDNDVSVVEQKITESNSIEDQFNQLLRNSFTQEKHTNKQQVSKPVKKISLLANNLDIFSDEEDEEPTPVDKNKKETTVNVGQQKKDCVSLVDDDDDIMVIDDDNNSKPLKNKDEVKSVDNNCITAQVAETEKANVPITVMNVPNTGAVIKETVNPIETTLSIVKENKPEDKPLVAKNFLKNFKSRMNEMTRVDLEDFCLIKIVEGVIDRSNLSEIKAKLKAMTQNVEEWRKKAMVLNKQNRDLQIVLRTVQEEQKKKSDEAITPLKITRSVGMQVLMGENKNENSLRARNQKRFISNNQSNQLKNNQPVQKQQVKNIKTPIPTPRLVPASPTKSPAIVVCPLQNSTITSNSGPVKTNSPNTPKTYTPPVKKSAEKRPLSDSIDLTDDEPTPPAKKPPVRLVPSQQLMAPGRSSIVNNGKTPPSPRQVYIPIGSQNVNIRPQPVYKPPGPQGVRTRGPSPGTIIRTSTSPIIRSTIQRNPHKHPAPLPQAFSQPQPPNWKALPPAPDLKISKIENGIVVSWKIDGYQESSYEEIVSYQLYAYQETSAPASTLLWNKIGDIKALPLPMACTLTQFIAGYKYYFAVRAVDIRSRIGPFSLPGSILLLNK